MKLEYIVVYKRSSDEFDIEHCGIKVKVTVDLQKFNIKQLRSSSINTCSSSINTCIDMLG